MKIIAVVNNKGGVGKTTTSRFLAEYFSIVKNEKVLAIDMDPQANFSNRYLKMEIDPYQQEGTKVNRKVEIFAYRLLISSIE